jgi:protein TonB
MEYLATLHLTNGLAQVHLISSPLNSYKMKPESILKADVLDILFENRNKEYGAYELRTHYPGRLKKSLLIIFSGLLVLIIINYWVSKNVSHTIISPLPPDVQLTDVSLNNKELLPLKPLPAPARRKIATTQLTTPLIIKQNVDVNPPPLNIDLINTQIGTVTSTGNKTEGNNQSGNGNNQQTNNVVTQPEADKETILDRSEIMPEFPGGLDALKRFLSKNLHMPKDNLDPGTSIRVQIRFVVDKEGVVTGIALVQSGGKDFDEEVLRVIKKMPRWKPGVQHGNKVAVYYHLPVVFEVPDENQ